MKTQRVTLPRFGANLLFCIVQVRKNRLNGVQRAFSKDLGRIYRVTFFDEPAHDFLIAGTKLAEVRP